MSKILTVELEVTVPEQLEATDKEIEEYLAFELGSVTTLSGSNPCLNSEYAPEVEQGSLVIR